MLAFGALFGTVLFNTFFVALTMFKVLPRQMFGRVQALLFPRYFGLTTGALAVLFAGAVAGCAAPASSPTVITLGVTLLLNAANWCVCVCGRLNPARACGGGGASDCVCARTRPFAPPLALSRRLTKTHKKTTLKARHRAPLHVGHV